MSIKLVLYSSILFFLSEFILMIVKHSKKRETKIRGDKKSLILFWITIPASLTLGFFTANYGVWQPLNSYVAIAGLSVLATGFLIRWISIIQLNKEFTVDVAITKDHRLMTNGLYKKIRHPSYLGLLLICFGLSVAMNSIISLIIITLPVSLALIYRIKMEENILIKEFGKTYQDYMKGTYRLIPKLY
ncbi:MAG: isoprenylcysteine carboxylmethyltransferase family protein [Calditrichaeota bacterium]|nr:isoprenylcysteine carboxylmethyltransferase family protein [Calditrichota bacterium]